MLPSKLTGPTFFAAALTLTLLGGCSSGPEPTLAVQSALIRDRTDDALVLAFVVAADNASPNAYPLADVEYSVSLNGKRVFEGLRSGQITLERFGLETFELPASIPASALTNVGTSVPYEITGKVTYYPAGTIAQTLYDRDWIRPTAPLSGRGTIDLTAPEQPVVTPEEALPVKAEEVTE